MQDMNVDKKRIVTLLRNLADELEKGKVHLGVAIAWVMQNPGEGHSMSGHFITHQSVDPGIRTTLRGEMSRLMPLEDKMDSLTPAVPGISSGAMN